MLRTEKLSNLNRTNFICFVICVSQMNSIDMLHTKPFIFWGRNERNGRIKIYIYNIYS